MDIDPATPQNDPTTTTTTNPTPHATSTPTATQTPTTPTTHTRTLTTFTLKNPPFAYAHLSLTAPTTTTTTTSSSNSGPDILQLRAYLTTALRQFLGDTGAAIPIDFLSVQKGGDAWVRVPRADLAAFVGAVTAFGGMDLSSSSSSSSGAGAGAGAAGGGGEGEERGRMVLRVVASGDWLGSLIGKEGEGGLWTGLG